jgi:hypothetical protein
MRQDNPRASLQCSRPHKDDAVRDIEAYVREVSKLPPGGQGPFPFDHRLLCL